MAFFNRDLVVFDLETTGMYFSRHEIVQIGAVRLDRRTLDEVESFSSLVCPEHPATAEAEAVSVHGIDYAQLKEQPKIVEVLQELEHRFPPLEVLLSSYNTPFDIAFLRSAYVAADRVMPYDLHSVDIWTLSYLYWCRGEYPLNPKKPIGFGLSDMAAILGIEAVGYHNALTDARVAAEVLRRLLVSK